MSATYVHLSAELPTGHFKDLLIEKDSYREALKEAQAEDPEAGPEIYFVPGAKNVRALGDVELWYADGDIKAGRYPEQFGE
jgi:hypothetical protein